MNFLNFKTQRRSEPPCNDVERLLQLHICALAFLGSVLLGMGQQSSSLPVLVLFAAVTSYWFTDRLGWFQLNRFLAYVAMLVVAFISLADFFDNSSRSLIGSDASHRKLMAIASLLVYVQIVLLYQKKSYRVYEQLAVFCLLQVVVAAIMNVGFQFGLLLVVYLLLSLSALSLFFLYREGIQFAAQRSSIVRSRKQVDSSEITDNSPIWRKVLGSRPIAYFHISPTSLGRSLLGWSFARHVVGLCVVTVAFTTMFFYSAPRAGRESWRQLIGLRQPTVGFTTEPSLNQMGQLLQDNKIVMRVAFYEGDIPIQVFSEPYLRGVTATNYQSDGRWARTNRQNTFDVFRRTRLPDPPKEKDIVRQIFVLEPSKEKELVALSPAFRIDSTPREITYNPILRELMREEERFVGQSRYQYSLCTTGLRFGRQASIVPQGNPQLDPWSKRQFLTLDRARFPKLIQIADDVLREQGIDVRENRLLAARALRSYFHLTEDYKYTLTLDMRRDRNVDPVEAFVSQHRRGHCLYFASALTLMLRSQGIPARLVLGYKPNEFNSVGNYFVVRQRHAHAWAEAYLEPGDVPDGFSVAGGYDGGGAWVRLDPTPGTSDGGNPIATSDTFVDRVNEAFDYAQLLWNDYVLAMDAAPDVSRESDEETQGDDKDSDLAIKSLTSNTFVEQIFAKVIGTSSESQSFRRSIYTPFIMTIIGVAALVLWIRFRGPLLQLIGRIFGRRVSDDNRLARAKHRVDFYERFERICCKLGVRRKRNETQLEFATSVSSMLTHSENGSQMPRLPREVASLFYQVRFGRRPLDKQQREEIENALLSIEDAISDRNLTSPSRKRSF
jgi:hypothetical protein